MIHFVSCNWGRGTFWFLNHNLKTALIFILISSIPYAKATNSCRPISQPSQVNCSANCTIPTSNQDLNINTNQTFCVKSGTTVNVQNVNMNGGELKVCGVLNLNTLTSNGSNVKKIGVASNAKMNINQHLNLSATEFVNFGIVLIHGDKFHLNGSNNKFINTVDATVDMTLSSNSTEFIINASNPSEQNEYYNFGKTLLQKLRVNASDPDHARICLNNSSDKYKFCVRKGMNLNPKTPFEVISDTILNPTTNIIDTAGIHDFQNFYNNGNVTQKLFKSPNGYNANWVYYQNSSTLPLIAQPSHPNFIPSLYERIDALYSNDQIDCNDSPLPIELISFSAREISKNDVEINWSTGSEINNDKFILSRSTDAKLFTDIATVDGRGNSNIVQQYVHIDTNAPNAKTVYYRLSQHDLNGNSKIFPLISVTRRLIDNTLDIYPQIINKEINQLSFNTSLYNQDSTQADMRIISTSGQVVLHRKIEIQNGQNSVDLPSNLSAGIYIVEVILNNQLVRFINKIVIQ